MTKHSHITGPTAFWLPDRPAVLASSSSIRSILLNQARIPHTVVPSSIDERALEVANPGLPIDQRAAFLATAKAMAVSAMESDSLVIGADQVCILDDKLIHKAGDIVDLKQKLRALRGKPHELISAASVCYNSELVFCCSDRAQMTMRNFSDEFLETYVEEEGTDLLETVGGYKIEGTGITLFSEIFGQFHTILGLPILQMLRQFRKLGFVTK